MKQAKLSQTKKNLNDIKKQNWQTELHSTTNQREKGESIAMLFNPNSIASVTIVLG